MDRILIVGGNGFVGGRIFELGTRLGHVVAIAGTSDKCSIPDCAYYKCDIAERSDVESVFSEFRPNLVINVAAIADIDFAETNQTLAYSVNVTGAVNCASVARRMGATYVWISSDAVFDGMHRNYSETSITNPINYYGKTKQIGEQEVANENPNSIILRLSLVLGLPIEKGNSFTAGLIEKVNKGEVVYSPINEVRTPIDVYTLAEAIFELYNKEFKGIIHLGSTDSLNRYEISKYIIEEIGLDTELIKPLESVLPGKAPRHRNGIISVKMAQSVLTNTKLLPTRETIKRSLKEGRPLNAGS